MTAHDEAAPLLGALLLGALEAGEARRVEEHVIGCAACTAEASALRDVVTALGRLDGDDVDVPAVPSGLADAVVTAVGADRRRRESRDRRRQALLAAVAAVAVLVGGVAVARDLQPAPPGPFEAVAAVSTVGDVEATAGVVPHTWGVEVVLTATGFDPGAAYRVEVLRRDGTASPAGEFVGTGQRRMVCRLNSAVLRADASGFVVRDAAGVEQARGALPVRD
jgi:anti-sigma factor RsiW